VNSYIGAGIVIGLMSAFSICLMVYPILKDYVD
jgi:hypothetical protein